MSSNSPEQRNYGEIERLENLLEDLRANPSTARETEAIREIGLEIALAVREVGAMLVNVGWEQSTSPLGHAGVPVVRGNGSTPQAGREGLPAYGVCRRLLRGRPRRQQ